MQRSLEGLRVTPWADWLEWWELKEMLMSGDVVKANERVQCYLMRRRQAVPVAMVSTVSLRYQLQYPSSDEYTQRLGLAMALVRFVNGMTDRLQPRGEGAFAKSVHSLSVELKLPPILVEIRHQASHNNLPRLTALESGARKALEWLEEHYWNAQYEKVRHQLENTPRGLRHIFARGSDSCSLDSTLLKEESQIDGASDHTTGEDNASVLRRVKTLSSDIVQGRSAKSTLDPDIRMEAGRVRSSGEQWIECGNYEAWKATPIGLIPGQKWAPRWPSQSAEENNDGTNYESDFQETSLLESADVPNPTSPNTFKSPEKYVKRLSPGDAEKVHTLTSYYEQLLKAHSNI